MSGLWWAFRDLSKTLQDISNDLDAIRKFYEFLDTKNVVKDGEKPFPENELDLSNGISIEFRNVTFKYSDDGDVALKNVSFKIEQGQLCVRLHFHACFQIALSQISGHRWRERLREEHHSDSYHEGA